MSSAGRPIQLPYGYKDAKVALLVVSVIGDFLLGGLVFGWNAMGLMLKELGNYSEKCKPGVARCASQESKLAILWTVGIFALNVGPVLVGPVLDGLGPKITTILGILLNIIGLALFAGSSSSGFDAFPYAAVITGLGGITFHLAQFHISTLYPRKRGLISSLLVAGFTGSGVIFYFLYLIFGDLGGSRGNYTAVLVGYILLLVLFIPLMLWIMPWEALKVGQMYLMDPRFRFKVVQRSDLEVKVSSVSLVGMVKNGNGQTMSNGVSTPPSAFAESRPALPKIAGKKEGKEALIAGQQLDSSDPRWTDDQGPAGMEDIAIVTSESPRRSAGTPTRRRQGSRSLETAHSLENGNGLVHLNSTTSVNLQVPDNPFQSVNMDDSFSPSGSPLAGASQQRSSLDAGRARAPEDVEHGPEGSPMHVAWGPLVFEARRFVELRKQSFRNQFCSPESFGMGLFYTLNVLCIQLYLGTTRLQLEHKGDNDHDYTDMANIIPAFGFLGIPIIGWLLDRKGYGVTLAVINGLGVLASVLQAIPVLGLQALTLIVWCAGRFFLYTSYFAIFGALFGFNNFGKMVAADNIVNGLVGLLQYPITALALHHLDGNFTWVNIAQIIVLLPIFYFCWLMYFWEREDLVPIRPMEGEELPCDMVGPRQQATLGFVRQLEKQFTSPAA